MRYRFGRLPARPVRLGDCALAAIPCKARRNTAIGSAKGLIETCCETIPAERGKATKTGAEDVGHGTKVAAKDTGKGVKTGAEKTGEGIKDAVTK